MSDICENSIRLSKYLAQQGICSRREADEYISRGWVSVNGQVAVLGQKIDPSKDNVQVNEKAEYRQSVRRTILLYKPVGYVSSQAEKNYRSALDLVTSQNYVGREKKLALPLRGLAPAGRLDIDSKGLLILTQDGRIAKKIIGEHSHIEKEYLVHVSGSLSKDGLKLLNHGLSLDGEALRPAKVWWQNTGQLRFILKQGKKRQIRRMCQMVGLEVTGLKRIRIGRVMLGDLPVGKWRFLRDDELF